MMIGLAARAASVGFVAAIARLAMFAVSAIFARFTRVTRVAGLVGLANLAAWAGPAPAQGLDAALLARITRAASEIHAALPASRPGHGTTDYPGHAEGDVPKSYAMVLLAELDRRGRRWRAGEADLARTAGQWLLANADSNRDGVVGWGLPVAWDAYDDGSVNPAHTQYTISTAIVVDALLTWADRDADAPRARIRATVHAALAPYLDARHASPSGMAPYSLAAADRRYDTFNPAAYLAGQLQRASLAVADHRERERYLAAADATMAALLKHRQQAPGSGHWFWHYSVQQALPNDLPHAGYVIAGIRAYIEHGGRLAARFDWPAVRGHLVDFRGPAGELRAFPSLRAELKLAARSYDLGFALHLACTETGTADVAALVPWLVGAIDGYRTTASGRPRYLKYPRAAAPAAAVPPAGVAPLVVNEYEAYLYRGLTSCAMAPRAAAMATGPVNAASAASAAGTSGIEGRSNAVVPLAATAASTALARELAAPAATKTATANPVVPLLPADAGLVGFDAGKRATITRADGLRLVLDTPGVPVKTLARGAASFVFLRRHPDDALHLLRYEGTRLVCRLEVRHGSDPTAQPSLRAATLHAGRVHAVVHHNPSEANFHLAWDGDKDCPERIGKTTRLPSLEEPAGSTYEMIPSLHFHVVASERLWLAGGNMQLEIGPDGPLAVQRLRACRPIIETVATPAGLAHLCLSSTVDATTGARRHLVVAPPGVAAPMLDPAAGVPWRLSWSGGALRIDHARSAAQLRHLIRRDIAATAPGGWMEFGINNEEGRIPWSQIYYLNGLLDLLDLARRDAQALELFAPLLPEVRQRLDLEMQWLDEHVAAGRHATRAFTVDRSRALFGVQTARFLLLMRRYLTELPDPRPLAGYAALKRAVPKLEGHIEVLATSGEDPRWIRPGLAHLRWPRGSKFSFDGLPVPYNHQNEWAYAVLATANDDTPAAAVRAATDVLRHFTDRIAPAGRLPASGQWDYWWGRAWDGWDEAAGVSVNRPVYAGDRIKAWISFRTIDAMALVSGAPRLGADEARQARASAQALAARGALYPFANHAWMATDPAIHLATPVAHEYVRVSAPWEIGSAVWSAAVLAGRWRAE
ncbi:MAG: hypothetical protein IT502_01300 [Rubrivivax sp.]|nr:hypothetical protein [Rubrivivax sp.]